MYISKKGIWALMLAVAWCAAGVAVAQSSATPAAAAPQPGPGATARRLDSLVATLPKQPDSLRPQVMKALALGYRRTDSDKAQQWAQRGAQEAQRVNRPVDYAHALNVMGMLAKDQGKYEQAITHQLTALKIHEQHNSLEGILNTNNDIGILYKRMKLLDKALPFFQQEVALCDKLIPDKSFNAKRHENFEVNRAYALNNIGSIYMEKKDLARAKPYFLETVAEGRRLKINDMCAVSYANLATTETGLGNLPAALSSFQQSLAFDAADANEYGQAETLVSMAGLYQKLNQRDKAVQALRKALDLATRVNFVTTQQQAHRELSQLYQQAGQYDLATHHYAQLVQLNDTIYNQDVTQKVAELQTKYDTERKEAQNQLQAAQLRIQQQVIRRRNTQLLAGLAVVALLAGLTYLLFNRRRLQQKLELEQERQRLERLRAQAVLEAEEKERRRIGSDLHDGVGQLLTAAKLNLHALGEELSLSTAGQQAMLQNALEDGRHRLSVLASLV